MFNAIAKYTTLFLSAFLLSNTASAATLNLYEQPAQNAKVVGTIDPSKGVMLIYTPKDSEWVKVADPQNGNVGWIKQVDLGKDTPTVTFTHRTLDNGKGTETYELIKTGNPLNLTDEQIKQNLERFEAHQKAMNESLQKSYQDMMKNFNIIFQEQYKYLQENNFPFLAPVTPPPAQKTEQKTTTNSDTTAKTK